MQTLILSGLVIVEDKSSQTTNPAQFVTLQITMGTTVRTIFS